MGAANQVWYIALWLLVTEHGYVYQSNVGKEIPLSTHEMFLTLESMACFMFEKLWFAWQSLIMVWATILTSVFLLWVNLVRWSKVKVSVVNQAISLIAPKPVTWKDEYDFPNIGSRKTCTYNLQSYLFVLTYETFQEKNCNRKCGTVVSHCKALLICQIIWGETIAQDVYEGTK